MSAAGKARTLRRLAACIVAVACPLAHADVASGYQALAAGDYERALAEWRPLAQAGDARARAMLGFAYEHGYGVPRDVATAMVLYEQAAAQGLAVVQHDLGTRYFLGEGVPQDRTRAAAWWRRAAEQGLAAAQLNLGLVYARGLGVERDDAIAAHWLEAAADQGNARAEYALGVLYATGRGLPQDLALAADAFAAAAPAIAEARYNLGILAEHGIAAEGASADPAYWYREAAAGGVEAAYLKLDLPVPADVPSTSTADALASPAASGKANGAGLNPAAEVLHEDWIAKQDPAHYTVQLATGVSETAMQNFLEDGEFAYERAYFKFLYQGEPRYTGIYGSFPTRAEARDALEALNPQKKRSDPLIRRYREVQALLKP